MNNPGMKNWISTLKRFGLSGKGSHAVLVTCPSCGQAYSLFAKPKHICKEK